MTRKVYIGFVLYIMRYTKGGMDAYQNLEMLEVRSRVGRKGRSKANDLFQMSESLLG
jgi:hypothetical protein